MLRRIAVSSVLPVVISTSVAIGTGLYAAGARTATLDTRMQECERRQTVIETEQRAVMREVLERLRGIENGVAEMRGEQRILHGR